MKNVVFLAQIAYTYIEAKENAMAPYLTESDFTAQTHAGGLEKRSKQPRVPDKTLGLDWPPFENDATPSSVFPSNIPVLRWARSGVSIVQFLTDEFGDAEWEADEPGGVRQEAGFGHSRVAVHLSVRRD